MDLAELEAAYHLSVARDKTLDAIDSLDAADADEVRLDWCRDDETLQDLGYVSRSALLALLRRHLAEMIVQLQRMGIEVKDRN